MVWVFGLYGVLRAPCPPRKRDCFEGGGCLLPSPLPTFWLFAVATYMSWHICCYIRHPLALAPSPSPSDPLRRSTWNTRPLFRMSLNKDKESLRTPIVPYPKLRRIYSTFSPLQTFLADNQLLTWKCRFCSKHSTEKIWWLTLDVLHLYHRWTTNNQLLNV